MPLQLVNSARMSGESPRYQSTIENIGTHPIVALAVKWTVLTGGTPRTISISKVDAWIGGTGKQIDVGKHITLYFGGVVIPGNTQTMRFEDVPVYVRFANGSREDPMPRAIFPVMEKTRQGILAEAQRALEVYNTSGKSALIAELAQTQAPKGKPRRMAANYFLHKMHQDGFKAALSALDLLAALQIPTSG